MAREQIEQRKEFSRVKQLVVDRLDVPVDSEWITDDQPLFGHGLELDSVDALKLVVGLESELAVSVTDDQMDVFGSVARLAEHIEEEL